MLSLDIRLCTHRIPLRLFERLIIQSILLLGLKTQLLYRCRPESHSVVLGLWEQ